MNMMLKWNQSTENANNLTRRGFMGWGVAVFIGIASLTTFLFTLFRMPFPSLLPEKSDRFKIGRRHDFPSGTSKYFNNDQVYVFADAEGIYAISAVCTHLGCVVHKNHNGFACPCHGSRYGRDGKVEKGAATRDLPWFQISMLPGGHLQVDKKNVVKPGVKFRL